MSQKTKKILATTIYAIGVCCVIFFGISAIVGGSTVKYPDVMLPTTEFERNIEILGFGFIPMLLSSIFMISAYKPDKRWKKLLILLPAIITGIPFVYGVGLLVLMLGMGIRDALGAL
ncbi:MAG: hypothetical protein IKR39_08735 [Lachnospiraceae bacterium]|nr:hypothetical protein [Lachnospiraceae bacterium]